LKEDIFFAVKGDMVSFDRSATMKTWFFTVKISYINSGNGK
jgi:hypothetical protein